MSAIRLPDWNCPNCNFKVFGSKPACGKCGVKNPGRQPASAAAPQLRSTAAAAAAPTHGRLPDWNCPNCNFKVFGSKPACGKCGIKNPGAPAIPDSAAVPQPWLCPKCRFLVFGTMASCQVCGSNSPSPVAAVPEPVSGGGGCAPMNRFGRAPDWNCPNCRKMVFGSKPCCAVCGAKNPAVQPMPSSATDAVVQRERQLAAREQALTAQLAAHAEQEEKKQQQQSAGLVSADDALLSVIPPPPAWSNAAHEGGGAAAPYTLVPLTDPEVLDVFQKLLWGTSPGSVMAGKARVKAVHRVQNTSLWLQYGTLRRLFAQAEGGTGKPALPLEPATMKHLQGTAGNAAARAAGLSAAAVEAKANEVFAFHGTAADVAPIICKEGFDERVGSLAGLYGAGVYFADDSAKSHGYTKPSTSTATRFMFVARVLLGKMTEPTRAGASNARRAPDGFDAVCGQTNARELIVYDRRQTYPEFLIEYDMSAVAARTAATGTTH